MKSKNGLNIGITIFVKADGDLGLWENGLRQNVVFLYHMLKNSPQVEHVYLLNHGDGQPKTVPEFAGFQAKDICRTKDVERKLDAVIMIGAAMDTPTCQRLRSRGCKIIKYVAGNGALISVESVLTDPVKPDAERYFDRDCYDVIWMTPQHIHSNKTYCETIYRCPVVEVPQTWMPMFVQARVQAINKPFGYDPARKDNKVGIFEPNINVLKTSHIPMLVCEEAHRKAPEKLDHVLVFNAVQLPERSPHFNAFCGQLEMVKLKKMTVEGRFPTADMLCEHVNMVVTHHWENGLNYLYYDALYGAYPLIHNSKFIQDVGYYYEDFNPASGGRALLHAIDTHRDNLKQYKEKADELLYSIDALNPEHAKRHVQLIEEVLS